MIIMINIAKIDTHSLKSLILEKLKLLEKNIGYKFKSAHDL